MAVETYGPTLDIPEFLKRKQDGKTIVGGGSGTAYPDEPSTTPDGGCHAAAPKPVIHTARDDPAPELHVPRGEAYDALLKKVRRRSRKREAPPRLS